VVGLFKSRRSPTTKEQPSAAPANAYRAVEIRGSQLTCAAAKDFKDQRFLLAASVPNIPLPYCDRKGECPCRYIHHADRRAGPRRAMEIGRPSPGMLPGRERRARRGRRADD
jgi:hypothetical protein